MRALKYWKGTALVTAGVLAGFLLGPPLAEAVTATLVKIQSCCTSSVAGVDSAHELRTITSANSSSVFAITEPNGETTVLSATGSAAKSTGSFGDIVGINVDVSSPGTSPVTVAVRKGSVQGSGQIIWQGTLPASQVGHIDATFGTQSILFLPGTNSGFNVNVANPGGAAVQYEVYGFGFGVKCCQRSNALWATAGKP